MGTGVLAGGVSGGQDHAGEGPLGASTQPVTIVAKRKVGILVVIES